MHRSPPFHTHAHTHTHTHTHTTPQGEDGLLPGLCLLTETWLGRVAVPMFKDTASAHPSTSLGKYFDDTRVETLITVYDEKDESLQGAITNAFGQLKRTVMSSDAGAFGCAYAMCVYCVCTHRRAAPRAPHT